MIIKRGPKYQVIITREKSWRREALKKTAFYSVVNNSPIHVDLLCDLLESISYLNFYSQVDFYILDAGLDPSQKNMLQNRYNIQIIPFDFGIYGMEIDAKSGAECARVFADIFIPGYEYYFYLDVDVWIQDENSLDAYLQTTLKQGVSGANTMYNMTFVADSPYFSQKTTPDSFYNIERFRRLHYISAGIICLTKEKLKEYRENVLFFIREKGAHYGTDYVSLNALLLSIDEPIVLPCHFNARFDRIKEHFNVKNNMLYIEDALIGVCHLAGPKDHYFTPIEIRGGSFLFKWGASKIL